MAIKSLQIIAIAAVAAASTAQTVTAKTPLGLTVVHEGDGPAITVEVASASAFRLGVRFAGWGTEAISTPSLDPARQPAPFSYVSWGVMSGVQTTFGAILAATDGSGTWALYDENNNTLVFGGAAPYMNNGTDNYYDAGIVLPVNGTAAYAGPGRPCLSNGIFDPPFYYNRQAGYLSFAVSSWDWDPANHHCYPVSFSGSVGAKATTPSSANDENCQAKAALAKAEATGADIETVGQAPLCEVCNPGNVKNETDVTGGDRSASYPNGLSNTTFAQCCAACNGASDCTAVIWSDGSHPDPTGTDCWPMANVAGTHPQPGRTFSGVAPPPPPAPAPAWWAMGQAADWYLAPAAVPLAFTAALYNLTGPAAIPPLYAVGFMATYWGYDNMEEVEGNMTAFRDGSFPIDSFIMDYDWWNTPNNANLDFGYDPIMFGNHSFIHPPGSTIPNTTTSGPVELFRHFHEDINMRFGGIRKPRTYSNIALSNTSGWLLPTSFSVGAGDNNWNMSAPHWANWYINNHLHFLEDGLDYWWNDEGETQWFTYTWWNAAQQQEYAVALPGQRFWTLNRAFQPGMQRFPAVTWTGDRQDCSHPTVLQFTTAGQPYTACDMTAPDATVLVRQYQNAVFLPIMRTHAMHGTPRFPYLWGGPEHQVAFREALNMRYHFLPHIYSLFHSGRTTGQPIVLPASYIFPNDPTFPVATGDATYMMSDVLLPADVSTSNGMDPNENTTHVNIPPGVWYTFNSTSSMVGPQPGLTWTNVALNDLMLWVRAGAILTLNKAVVQYTSALGGDLELHVYAGRDGAFTLVEDDGNSLGYQSDYDGATRRTAFVWSDATRTLTWTVTGAYTGDNGACSLYSTIWPVLFTPNATAPVYHAAVPLGTGGSVSF